MSTNLAFIGNPNCGKTTLFNAYTGARLKVANWPGVTVEKKEGSYSYHNNDFKLVDLPGIYSLTCYTMEEKVARRYILDGGAEVIIDVVDASCLERNLYLTLQLIELGKPVVVALNMMDIVEERGMEIDLHRLPEMLGVPVIPVSARRKKGLDVLMHAVAHHKDKKGVDNLEHSHKAAAGLHRHDHHSEYTVVYSDEIEDLLDVVEERISQTKPQLENKRWYAIKVLENDSEVINDLGTDFSDIVTRSYEKEIINQKYEFIEEIIEECLVNKEVKAERTEKIDSLLTHPVLGLPVFLGIMALVFFLTFKLGDFLAEWLSKGIDLFSAVFEELLISVNASEILRSLLLDGIVAGVGGILTFLPNIFILFLCLAILEDSGYMSRVAYVMDGIMSKIGVSGKAFIPMLLGFGCTVPAIMASRALENKGDRFRTILITPFMSCSARLPIYVLFSNMFFHEHALAVAYSMYLMGIVVAIIVALIIHKFGTKTEKQCLLIELPEYKTPNAESIAIYVLEKVKDYLTKAGTVIFLASIILWFVLNFNINGLSSMEESFAASIGRIIAPIFAPVGIGQWQLAVSLIAGIAAKEVVVSSTGVLFGIGNINSTAGMAELGTALGALGFGKLNAYALMVFCLLYTPCAATIAVIRKETNSSKKAAFCALFQLAVAYTVTFLVYNIGKIIIG